MQRKQQPQETTKEQPKPVLSPFWIPRKAFQGLSTRKKIKKMNEKYDLVLRTLQEIQDIAQEIFSDETDPYRILVETAISMHKVHCR